MNTPPGPKGYPIIGNVLEFPKYTDYPWLTYAEWAKIYGDLVHVTVLGQSILVLNSYEAAIDLLERRSSIYSDRPTLVHSGATLTYLTISIQFNRLIGFSRYSDQFRKKRQVLKKELVGNALVKYWSTQEKEGRALIHDVLTKPVDLVESIRLFAGSIIMQTTYGYKALRTSRDPFLHAAEQTMLTFTKVAQPGAWAIDFLPWLRYVPSWIPGATFQKVAKEGRDVLNEMKSAPYLWNKEHQDDPMLTRPNISTSLLADMGQTMTEDDEEILSWATGRHNLNFIPQTVLMVSSFFLAMALFPDIQQKGQDEIDQLLKGKRLPDISDRPSLPFVVNIMREILRWRPLGNLALPHRVMRDDEYKGYLVPKDTIVVANTWAVLHNPEVFPDPEEFDPSRYVGNDKAVKIVSSAFGYGRRACPGMQFAESSMFLAIATALATCNISNATYPNGRPVEKSVLYTSEIIRYNSMGVISGACPL
ncbi:cytochrome P450 [Hysterangium stoloniferum]|nr:cytochrome P450 [Hysterangium stoloniferum]KAF8522565.1 cytochrome P450 [Hysterangium stoloniferum]